jgi:glutathione S-transferase
MTELLLYQYGGRTRGTTLSAPCAKVHMALRFKGLSYDVKNLHTPMQVKKVNPRGRVPALRMGAELIVDSSDILTALDARFPQAPLLPQQPLLRAQAKLYEDWADEVLYFFVVYLRWATDAGFRRLREVVLSKQPAPLRWIVPAVARRMAVARLRGQGTGLKDEHVVRRELSECLDALDILIQDGPFLLGAELSRADLSVCAVVDQLRVPELTPDAASAVDAHDHIRDWARRVHDLAPSAA